MTTYHNIYRRSEPNLLLQSFDEATVQNFLKKMELVPLVLGKILQEPGIPARYAYFPTTCVVSLMGGTENTSTAEIAVIGNEGVVGVTNIIGEDVSTPQAIVQSTGFAYRIHMNALRQEFHANPQVHSYLLKYMQALMAHMTQTAVCNRHHTLDQQLCRWFLHCLDRLPSKELVITQEFIAYMLGVRREGVTVAAGNLQKAGIIRYRRGRISIEDRSGLEARACECYALVRKDYQRLLPAPQQPLAATLKIKGAPNKTFNIEYAPLPSPTRDLIGARA